MTSTSDREWGELAVTWRAETDLGPERFIRAMVLRQSRWMRIVLGSEILVTVAVLGFLGSLVARQPTGGLIAWGIAAGLHTALIWGFALWNRRGVWRPLGDSTRAYLAVAVLRAHRERRAAWFVIGLVSVEAVLVIGLTVARGRGPAGWIWTFPASVVLAAVGWAVLQLSRSAGRLARLEETARALGLGPDA